MNKKQWKLWRHHLEYTSLHFMMMWLWLVSPKTARTAAEFLGWFAFTILRIRRRVTLKNLTQAFPEKSEKWRLTIARKSYQQFAKTVFEFTRFHITDRKTLTSLCEVEGKEHLEDAHRNGKGILFISAHFGNWELVPGVLTQMGYPVTILVGRQRNRMVDTLMNAFRAKMETRVVTMNVAVRGTLKALRNNDFVIFLSDQNAGRNGIFVNFFNKKASTPAGAAAFSLRTGAPIIFFIAIREKCEKHRIIIHKIECHDLEGTMADKIQRITQTYTTVLEKAVREHPDHYFWMHKRWKSRPPEERKL